MNALSLESLEDSKLRCIAAEQTAKSIAALPILQAFATPQSHRIAIKVKEKSSSSILAMWLRFRLKVTTYCFNEAQIRILLRDSISVVAEKLEPYGFIRIHRSVLVNASFVEAIKPYSTGEYGLQVKGGKEYTVTRTYKKNLKFLAKFCIGNSFFC
jgi:hypothetical protein